MEIILIGGTAALLAYHASRATIDIDTWNSVKELTSAYKKAKQETGMNIPLGQAGVSDAPINFEDRLKPFKPKSFKRLSIKVPDVADLILMKTVRGYEHDLQVIAEMVEANRVGFNRLVNLFTDEFDHAVGDKRKLELNFIVMIERSFGSEKAKAAQKAIGFT